jgi:hypothetical protein
VADEPIDLAAVRQRFATGSWSAEDVDRMVAEVISLRWELGRWKSGQRTRGRPALATIPDGLRYAAELVRAQGTEGGERHDDLLREAGIRLRDLNDLASRQQDELVHLRDDVATLVQPARLYLNAIDDDPEHEMLTLGEAYSIQALREVVERWEAENRG